MSQKTFKFVVACITGVQTIVVGAVTYFVKDAGTAALVNSALVIATGAAIEICDLFVKDK